MITINLTLLITIISALVALIGWLIGFTAKQTKKQAKRDIKCDTHEGDIKDLKDEQCLLCYGMLGCLDGLKQLGANGRVTETKNRLEKHLNQQAHD